MWRCVVVVLVLGAFSTSTAVSNEPRLDLSDARRGDEVWTWLTWHEDGWKVRSEQSSCPVHAVRWTEGLDAPGPDDARVRYALVRFETSPRWRGKWHGFRRPPIAEVVEWRPAIWPGAYLVREAVGGGELEAFSGRLDAGATYALELVLAPWGWTIVGLDELGAYGVDVVGMEAVEAPEMGMIVAAEVRVVDVAIERTFGRRCDGPVSSVRSSPRATIEVVRLEGSVVEHPDEYDE